MSMSATAINLFGETELRELFTLVTAVITVASGLFLFHIETEQSILSSILSKFHAVFHFVYGCILL